MTTGKDFSCYPASPFACPELFRGPSQKQVGQYSLAGVIKVFPGKVIFFLLFKSF